MGKKATRIFFFSTLQKTFVKVDKEILERNFRVLSLITRGVTAVPKILFYVLRCDVGLAWFGSVYSAFLVFFSRMFGKPSMIIVGGVDAAKDREINYGIWLNPWKAKLVKYAFRNADKILVVDPALGKEAARLAEYDGSNIVHLPTGYDGSRWLPSGPKEHVVLTVAWCNTLARLKAKGIDKFIAAAQLMPETRFILVGAYPELISSITNPLPTNLEIAPRVDQQDLLKYYRRSWVYCQASRLEGFPNALCEAMLCGCFPVGTLRGGIPSAIGDAGLLIPYGDIEMLVKALRTALAMPSEAGLKARQRIIENFPLERREQGLVNIVKEFVG